MKAAITCRGLVFGDWLDGVKVYIPCGKLGNYSLNLKFCQMSKKINKFIKLNLLIYLFIWQNLRLRNICQVFHTGSISLRSQGIGE